MESRRNFIKKGLLVFVGAVAGLFGLKGKHLGSEKDYSHAKKAMHWKKLAG